jgi:hypothetical protein
LFYVTYKVHSVDTTINSPKQPWFWETTVVPGQILGMSGSGISAPGFVYGMMMVYNKKGQLVYTDSAYCK